MQREDPRIQITPGTGWWEMADIVKLLVDVVLFLNTLSEVDVDAER